jgi:hypothetical protein
MLSGTVTVHSVRCNLKKSPQHHLAHKGNRELLQWSVGMDQVVVLFFQILRFIHRTSATCKHATKFYPAAGNDASNGFGRPDVNRSKAEELRSVDEHFFQDRERWNIQERIRAKMESSS